MVGQNGGHIYIYVGVCVCVCVCANIVDDRK